MACGQADGISDGSARWRAPSTKARASATGSSLTGSIVDFSRPERPTDSVLVESFNKRLRDIVWTLTASFPVAMPERKIQGLAEAP